MRKKKYIRFTKNRISDLDRRKREAAFLAEFKEFGPFICINEGVFTFFFQYIAFCLGIVVPYVVSDKDIDNFASSVAPLLNDKQRKTLSLVVEKLKKIK